MPAAALDLSLCPPLAERLVKARDEAFVIKRFAQEAERSGLHGLGLDVFLEIRCYKYDWNAAAIGDQSILQVDSAHAWHVEVGNQAGRMPPMFRLQIFFG